jgi:hypothetical protein
MSNRADSKKISNLGFVDMSTELDSVQEDHQIQPYDKNHSLTPNFVKYKKFVELEEEAQDTLDISGSDSKSGFSGFLKNVSLKPKAGMPGFLDLNKKKEKANSDKTKDNTPGVGINSIGSIFSKDHEEVNGLRRVFKKSIVFLSLHIIFFLGLTLAGLNFFNINILFSLLALISYVAITNIFFIVVADRSYVFIGLLIEFILLILVNTIFGLAGLGFHPITLAFTAIILLFTYLAYAELEKIQLSSRLFSISHITSESTRILLTIALLITSLGIFNSIKAEGSGDFVERVIFNSSFLGENFLMDTFILDASSRLTLNGYLMDGGFAPGSTTELPSSTFSLADGAPIIYFDSTTLTSRNATFRDFLIENYDNETLISEKDERQIRTNCPGSFDSQECDEAVVLRENEILEGFRADAYTNLEARGLNLEFDSELNVQQFRELTKQHYQNRISDLESVEENQENSIIPTELLIVPIDSIIPAFVAVGVYIVLFLLKFLFSWASFILASITWSLLKLAGVVQIDIETVESEIVTI